MRGYFILRVVHIARTIIIEAVIGGLSKGDYLEVIMIVLNHLQFFMIDKGAEDISTGMKPCLRLSWVESLIRISPTVGL